MHVPRPHYIAGPALDAAAELGLPAVFDVRDADAVSMNTMSRGRTAS